MNITVQKLPADDVIVRRGARLLSKGDVLDKVGLSYVSVWKLMREGAFPRSVVVGAKVAWLEHEVDEYIAKLPRRRLKGGTDGVPYHHTKRKAKAEAATSRPSSRPREASGATHARTRNVTRRK
jgi:predicted DNA-binding transcriptional regulator AlpA